MDNNISPHDVLIGNELIKDYMGIKLGEESFCYRMGAAPEPLQFKHLNYHKEWGWLMPVVAKIQKEGYGFHTSPHDIEIINYKDGSEETVVTHVNYEAEGIFEMYYHAVVLFIEWYNKQQK